MYLSAQIIYWTTVEVNVAIVCACIMTLKPLIQKWFPSILTGSNYVRSHSLRWITPLNSRASRHSVIRPGTNQGSSHQRVASDSESKRGNLLPRVEERDDNQSEHALKVGDLEAQRSGSVSTVIGEDDTSSVGMSALRAPPKAHLRLSIHVTKSVHVSKHPESPVPGEASQDRGAELEMVGDPRQVCGSPGWRSEGSTVMGDKD